VKRGKCPDCSGRGWVWRHHLLDGGRWGFHVEPCRLCPHGAKTAFPVEPTLKLPASRAKSVSGPFNQASGLGRVGGSAPVTATLKASSL